MKLPIFLFLFIFSFSLVSAAFGFDNSGVPRIQAPDPAVVTFNNNSGSVNSSAFWDNLDTPADITANGIWTRSGNFIFPTTLADFVGLGTNSPDANIHILDGSNPKFYIESQADDRPTFRLINSQQTWDTRINNALGEAFEIYDVTNGDSRLQIIPNSYIFIPANDLIIDTGNVGIGTASPSAELDVVGNVEINQNLSVGIGVPSLSNLVYLRSNFPDIYFFDDDWGGQTGSIYGTGEDGGAWTDGRMTFQSVITGGALDDTLNLKNAEVGIGTINPTHTLNVVGDMNLTGDMWFEGKIDAGWNAIQIRDENTTLNEDGSGRVDLFVMGRADHKILDIDGDTYEVDFNVTSAIKNRGFSIDTAGGSDNFYIDGNTDQICMGDLGLDTCLQGSQKIYMENTGDARVVMQFVSWLTGLEAFANSVFEMNFNSNSSGGLPRATSMSVNSNLFGATNGEAQSFNGFGSNILIKTEAPYNINITESAGFKSQFGTNSQEGYSRIVSGYGFFSKTGTENTMTGTLDVDNYYHFKAQDFKDFTNGDTTNLTGLWIDKQTTGTNNYGIVLAGDGAGADISFGDDKDASMYYDGTDLIINPRAVGSGNLIVQSGLEVTTNNITFTDFKFSNLSRTSLIDGSVFGLLMTNPPGVEAPHFWVQSGGGGQASGVARSFMIVNENTTRLNSDERTDCQGWADEFNKTLDIDCNTTTTGADLLVGDDVQIFGTIYTEEYTPQNYRINDSDGTYSSGDADDMSDMFGNDLVFNEVGVGSPSLNVVFNLSVLEDAPKQVVARWNYTSQASETLTWDLYDYDTNSWVNIRSFSDNGNQYYDSMTMNLPENLVGTYVDANNILQMRVINRENGNAANYISIDYLGVKY